MGLWQLICLNVCFRQFLIGYRADRNSSPQVGNTRPQRRTLGALLLREFRSRWYVLAHMTGSGWPACFGRNHIQRLIATGRSSSPPPGFEAATYFDGCFDITRPTDGSRPQKIRLRFKSVRERYALSYPLHSSQQVVTAGNDEVDMGLTVYDTYELRMELLSCGPDVQVLVPTALREWLRMQHRAAAAGM